MLLKCTKYCHIILIRHNWRRYWAHLLLGRCIGSGPANHRRKNAHCHCHRPVSGGILCACISSLSNRTIYQLPIDNLEQLRRHFPPSPDGLSQLHCSTCMQLSISYSVVILAHKIIQIKKYSKRTNTHTHTHSHCYSIIVFANVPRRPVTMVPAHTFRFAVAVDAHVLCGYIVVVFFDRTWFFKLHWNNDCMMPNAYNNCYWMSARISLEMLLVKRTAYRLIWFVLFFVSSLSSFMICNITFC